MTSSSRPAIRVAPTPSVRRWSSDHGYNPELVARWAEFYPDLPALLRALDRPAKTFIRLNALRGDPQETVRRLEAKGVRLAPTALPAAWEVLETPFSVGATEEYLMGRYYVQDLSSLLASLALEPRRGERIADLAAAPGGKTVALADAVDNQAALFAFEPPGDRVRSLESNLHRCGVTCAAVCPWPGQEAPGLGVTFDRVLLDAPCTGEGVIQRDPNRRKGHLGEYEACASVQWELLDAAARVLKPGGRLVYSTCTLAPEENELQIQRALESGLYDVEDLPAALRKVRLGDAPLLPGLTQVGPLRLDPRVARTAHALPHPHGTLGFFVACLRRRAS